jgi:hypothetical protein
VLERRNAGLWRLDSVAKNPLEPGIWKLAFFLVRQNRQGNSSAAIQLGPEKGLFFQPIGRQADVRKEF